MVIRKEKKPHCAAFSIILLAMSRLSQGRYNIIISMLVNRASINAVAQHGNVHRNKISRLQSHFPHSGIICNCQRSVTTPARGFFIFIPCTLRNRFPDAAMTLRNIHDTRRITGQTMRSSLYDISPVPRSLQ